MHIRNRLAAALAAVAIALAGVSAYSTNVSAQTVIVMEAGQTVELTTVPVGDALTFTVSPFSAGTLQFTAATLASKKLTFTASAPFRGIATIRDATLDIVFYIEVNGPDASIGATFRPKPAPGACLLIVSGSVVDFGDVTVGSDKLSATQTTVQNCSVNRRVLLKSSISQATSGSGPGAVTWQPALINPGPNEFSYTLARGPGLTRPVPKAPTLGDLFELDPSGPGAGFAMSHTLSIGAGSTTGLNSQFGATLTLTGLDGGTV